MAYGCDHDFNVGPPKKGVSMTIVIGALFWKTGHNPELRPGNVNVSPPDVRTFNTKLQLTLVPRMLLFVVSVAL